MEAALRSTLKFYPEPSLSGEASNGNYFRGEHPGMDADKIHFAIGES